MRTAPFLFSLGLVSAGLLRREPEAVAKLDDNVKEQCGNERRGWDLGIDIDKHGKLKIPHHGHHGDKHHGDKKHSRRQDLLSGFDENAAADDFMSDRGLRTWNDFSAPVDGNDACVVFKALEFLAFSLIEPTGDILSDSGTRVFVPADEQSGPLVLDLRGIIIWQAILERFKAQLEATNVWGIDTQLQVATCYLTYSQQAGNFLRALNGRERIFDDSNPAKCLLYDKIEALYIAYDVVATLIYGRNSGIPANIQQLITNAFPDPIPDTFRTPYAAPAPRSLIADYLSIHDDPLPSGDNLFEQAQEAFTCTDFREDPRPGTVVAGGANNRNRQRPAAATKTGKAAEKGKGKAKAANKETSKKITDALAEIASKKGDAKNDSKAKDAKKASKKEKRARKTKGSEDGKYWYRGSVKIGKDTDYNNIFIDDWIGTTGFDELDGVYYYNTIPVKSFKHTLSMQPSFTPKWENKFYGQVEKNKAEKAALDAIPWVPAEVYEKEHGIVSKEEQEKREKEEKEKKKQEKKEKKKKEKEEKERKKEEEKKEKEAEKLEKEAEKKEKEAEEKEEEAEKKEDEVKEKEEEEKDNRKDESKKD